MKKVLSFLVSGLLALGLFSCADGSVSLNYTDLHDLKATKLDLTGLYFRGSPNSWNATALTVKEANSSWTVEFTADNTDIAFKFSDTAWTPANTYNDSYMVAGTLPTGAKLTNTDDGNGSTNAKITGLNKDSQYKMTVTATNEGKLSIGLDAANYSLFSLAGYYYRGLNGTWDPTPVDIKDGSGNITTAANKVDEESFSEDENHTLTYTYNFIANATDSVLVVADSSWNNKFCSQIKVSSKPTATSSELGKSAATVLRYRRLAGTPMALNTKTMEYVKYSNKVTYRIPDYYTTDGDPASPVSTKDAGKLANDAEFEANYYEVFNATGKKVVSIDPTLIEDGSFAEKWASLSTKEKEAYFNVNDIDHGWGKLNLKKVDTILSKVTVGKPGKVVVTEDNNYYPVYGGISDTDESGAGDLPEAAEYRGVSGLIAGQPYKLTISVTTKGIITATIEEQPVTVAVVINGTNGTAGKEYTINGDLWKDVKATAASDGAFRFAAATFETRANYTFSKKLTIKGDGCNWSGDTVVTYTPVTTSNKTFVATTFDVSAAKPASTAMAVASTSDLSMRIVMKVPDDIAAKDSVTIDSNLSWGGFKNGKWADINTDDKFKSGPANSGNELVVVPNKTEKTITFFISADYDVTGTWVESQAAAGTNFKFQFSEPGYANNGGWFNITSDSVQNLDYAAKK